MTGLVPYNGAGDAKPAATAFTKLDILLQTGFNCCYFSRIYLMLVV
jgi:hypothetical protein